MVAPNLHVVLSAGGVTRNVTRRMIDGLDFSNTAPGGFLSCNVNLSERVGRTFAELTEYATLDVIDGRSAMPVWSGRLEQPGRETGQGERRQLTAVGGSSHAKDSVRPVVYYDARASMWAQADNGAVLAATFQQQDAGGVPGRALFFSFPKGTVVPANGRVVARYYGLIDTGQTLARMLGNVTFGRASSVYSVDFVGRGGPSVDTLLKSLAGGGAPATLIAQKSTDFPATDHIIPEIRLFESAGETVPNDLTWAIVDGPDVLGTRLDRDGVAVDVTAYNGDNTGVLPHDIVADVLGRYLPEFARSTAEVDTSLTTRIDQMAYDDPVDADQILSDLMLLNPTHYWAAWESTQAGYRFEWTPWPLEVSSDLDTRRDAFSSPGGVAQLFNEVTVRWKDGKDRPRATVATGDSPALTAAGLTRRGLLDLGSQIGSANAAAAAGAAFLTAHKYPDNSGTIKVSRPVADVLAGRVRQPWEWRAGVLVRVSNLAPYPDALNLSTSNGVTVFRVSSVSYSARDNTATLALDSYSATVARALARLAAAARNNRRA